MLTYAVEAFLARNQRRVKYSTSSHLEQIATLFPALSLFPSDYGVEIGGSPSFEMPWLNDWRAYASDGDQPRRGRAALQSHQGKARVRRCASPRPKTFTGR